MVLPHDSGVHFSVPHDRDGSHQSPGATTHADIACKGWPPGGGWDPVRSAAVRAPGLRSGTVFALKLLGAGVALLNSSVHLGTVAAVDRGVSGEERGASRQIVVSGGAGYWFGPDGLKLDEYAFSLTNQARPRVCVVCTASGDSRTG